MDKKTAFWTGVFTLIMLIAVCFAAFHKSTGQEPIASDYDGTISLSGEQSVLIQSWEANSRNITGFLLYTQAEENMEAAGSLRLRIKEQAEAEDFLCEGEVSLAKGTESGEYRFSLPKTRLELGKRYYFQIELLGEEKAAPVAVRINSNYAGLSLAGEESQGAIQGTVCYEMPGNLAWMMRIVLLFSGLAALLMLLFNRSFEEVLALTFGIVFVYLYLFGIFEQLEVGIWSLYIIGMLSAIAIPFLTAYKGRRWSEMISPGMVAFWALFFLYFILDRNVVAGKADDLNHWQLAVRDMWYFDSYPFHPGSTLIALRYTPGFATIEYLFLRLYGSYREGVILLACHTIGFAMLSVLYTKIPWKQCHKALPLTALIAGFPLLIYQSHYGILYVDAYLGMIGAYLLICYFTEEYSFFQILRITVGSIFLVMTKEMGLVIAGTVFLIIFIDVILKKKKQIKVYLLSGILTLGSFITWQAYSLLAGAKYGYHSSSANILQVLDLAKARTGSGGAADEILLASTAGAESLQRAAEQVIDPPAIIADATPKETVIEMICWFFEEKTFPGGSYIELTLIVILLCSVLGIAGVYRKLKIPMKQIIISLLVGTVLYAAFLVVCYIFLFREASAIPAARRYMGSYLLLFLITIPGILIVSANREEEKAGWRQPLIWVVSLFILLCVPDGHPYYTTEENFGGFFTTWKNHQTIGEVFRSFADKDEKVYYVEYSNSDLIPQYNYLTFFNAIVPNLTQGLNGGWKPVVSGDSPYHNYTVQYTADAWGQVLAQQYTYVYLRYVDDYFKENYGSLFASEEEIESGAIFKVSADDAGVTLRRIAFKNLN